MALCCALAMNGALPYRRPMPLTLPHVPLAYTHTRTTQHVTHSSRSPLDNTRPYGITHQACNLRPQHAPRMNGMKAIMMHISSISPAYPHK